MREREVERILHDAWGHNSAKVSSGVSRGLGCVAPGGCLVCVSLGCVCVGVCCMCVRVCAVRRHLLNVVAHIPLLPFIACSCLAQSQLGGFSALQLPRAAQPLLYSICMYSIVLEQCYPFGCATDSDLASRSH